MKRSMKVFGGLVAAGLMVSTMSISAHYGEKGCWNYHDHSCFNHDDYGQCIHYVDSNNDGICDHCWKVNQDVLIPVSTVDTTTYNSGTTTSHYGYHHGNHHGHHNCW